MVKNPIQGPVGIAPIGSVGVDGIESRLGCIGLEAARVFLPVPATDIIQEVSKSVNEIALGKGLEIFGQFDAESQAKTGSQ